MSVAIGKFRGHAHSVSVSEKTGLAFVLKHWVPETSIQPGLPESIPVVMRTRHRLPQFEWHEVEVVGRIHHDQYVQATKIKILPSGYVVNPSRNNFYWIVGAFIAFVVSAQLVSPGVTQRWQPYASSLWALVGHPLYDCPGNSQVRCTNATDGHRMQLSPCPEDPRTWCGTDEHGASSHINP